MKMAGGHKAPREARRDIERGLKRELKRPPIESLKDTRRIAGFSDGVFAVAITLLVLQIPIPVAAPNSDLATELANNEPMYISYVISFWVIAQFWLKHLDFNNHVKQYNLRLISVNFLYLMVLTFLPFPTAVYGTHSNDLTAGVLYAGTVAAAGLISTMMWLIATSSPHLLESGVSVEMTRRRALVSLVSPSAFLLSILVMFAYVPAAIVVWVSVGFFSPLLRRL